MAKQALWVLLIMTAVCLAAAYAIEQTITVDMPYPFIVEGKQLPAGAYSIEPTDQYGKTLTIRSADDKQVIQAIVLTRIAGAGQGLSTEPKVVLDKFDGDRYVLSEVFFQGEDGFLLTGANNSPHKHEMIKAKNKKT